MGGRPSKGTPADKRLKGNKGKPAAGGASSAAQPKFGSPAWDAKYGIKPGFGNKRKGKGK